MLKICDRHSQLDIVDNISKTPPNKINHNIHRPPIIRIKQRRRRNPKSNHQNNHNQNKIAHILDHPSNCDQ